MRGLLATCAIGALLACATGVSAAQTHTATTAQRSLSRALTSGIRSAGRSSGASVVDLTTGQTLFSSAAVTGRLPASVEKVYTTSTALLRFGPNATLTTSVLGRGVSVHGTWVGTFYLRGGGDPTFGSQSFDQINYDGGATMQRLVANLVRATGITALKGRVVGDETRFDSLRGTPATGYQPSLYVEGELSALAYDRGWSDLSGTTLQR